MTTNTKNPSDSKPKLHPQPPVAKAAPSPSPYQDRDHEAQNLTNDDIYAVASLFNRVGGALTEVDKQNVGGSSIQAQKLDPNAVLAASKSSPVPAVQTTPVQTTPVQTTPQRIQSPVKQKKPVDTNTSDTALLKRIKTLETTVANLSKIHDNILKRLSKNPKKITISLT